MEAHEAIKVILESIWIDVYASMPEEQDYKKYEHEEIMARVKNGEDVTFCILLKVDYERPPRRRVRKTDLVIDGWIWDCYDFRFTEEEAQAFAALGYDEAFWQKWVKQSWGKPDYEQVEFDPDNDEPYLKGYERWLVMDEFYFTVNGPQA